MSETIEHATIDDLEDLVPLFDGYRQFYGQSSDPEKAHGFLRDRIERSESIIFVARDSGRRAVGFTQLFPSFTSTACARVYILNDLFVAPDQRGKRVAAGLLAAAAAFGRKMGAARLTLSTGVGNAVAQGVYETAGWKRTKAFTTYNLAL